MKFGIRSFLMVGLMAVIFIVLSKVIVNKYVDPANPVSKLVNAI